MEWSWDILRWANVIAAVIVVGLMTAATVGRWHRMSLELRLVMPWVIATYVIVAYGSGEILAADHPVPPGLRVTLMLVDLIGLAISLVLGIYLDKRHTVQTTTAVGGTP